MAQPKGTQYTIFKPHIWIATVGAKLPKMNKGYGSNWADPTVGDPKWTKVPHTEEGAVISPSAPKDDITSDEAGGAIGVVPAGGAEITIGFTPITPDLDLFSYLSSMQLAQDVAAVTNADPNLAYPAYKRFALTPEGKQFMIGIEGTFSQGSLTEHGGFVRAFGYKVEQTDEVEINLRRTGEDAVMRLGAEVRCLNTTVAATQIADTGITATDERFDIFIVPATTS